MEQAEDRCAWALGHCADVALRVGPWSDVDMRLLTREHHMRLPRGRPSRRGGPIEPHEFDQGAWSCFKCGQSARAKVTLRVLRRKNILQSNSVSLTGTVNRIPSFSKETKLVAIWVIL